jgi:cytoskeletal protein RodZ
MSEANIRFALLSNPLAGKTLVDSSVNQPTTTEETEVYSTNDRPVEIPLKRGSMTWEDRLREITQEFTEIRTAQGISIYQVHAQTLVPLHIIQALEAGNFQRLPERIYVQGFVRRIGDYLGFDGAKLADSLPGEDPVNSLPQRKPFWTFSGLYFTRFHLYLGYVALLMAAVSALGAIANPSAPQSSTENSINPIVDAETSGPQTPSTIKK